MGVVAGFKFGAGSSEAGANPADSLVYVLRGDASDTRDGARAALIAAAPATYNGLYPESYVVEDHPDAVGVWTGTVRYSKRAIPDSSQEPSFSFDTSGGTQHITQSLSTIDKYWVLPDGFEISDEATPDFHGGIGVTKDSVQGVDITCPQYRFSETHYLADSVVTEAYKGVLFRLTGTVNTDTFRGLAAGECLFLGASGSKRGNGTWEITFNFAGSPNRDDITVGGITEASTEKIAKKGWEYMWVRYENVPDATSGRIIQVPTGVYIEKVYRDGDFSGLGI